MQRLAWLIATWFGCGKWPWGPGTAGSIAAVLIAAATVHLGDLPPWVFGVLAMLATPAAIWASTTTARATGSKDPGIIVVDEVLGQWLALAAAPNLGWGWSLASLALFRVFDIFKPWPVRRFERLKEGTGIVADDLAAGIYASLVILALRWLNQ